MKVVENALTELLDVLIEWETAIVEELWTNLPMKRMIAQKLEESEYAKLCFICRHAF